MAKPVPIERQVGAVILALREALENRRRDEHIAALESAVSTLEGLRRRMRSLSSETRSPSQELSREVLIVGPRSSVKSLVLKECAARESNPEPTD